MIRLLAALALLMSSPVQAADYVETQGPLSDDAFYRLVACGAAPGGACSRPFVRWPQAVRGDLRVGILRTSGAFPDPQAARAALAAAIKTLNDAGLGLRLQQTTRAPHISMVLSDLPMGGVIQNSGVPGLDGRRIGAAYVHVWWNGENEITRAAIILSRELQPSDYASVILEELVQALGPLTDIRNPAYAGRSIFAADDNLTTVLAGQDLAALRRLYQD